MESLRQAVAWVVCMWRLRARVVSPGWINSQDGDRQQAALPSGLACGPVNQACMSTLLVISISQGRIPPLQHTPLWTMPFRPFIHSPAHPSF